MTIPRTRDYSFFGDGLVAHIGIAEPFCPHLREVLCEATEKAGGTVHMGGTFIIIEGPRFSTRGESNIYRSWGMDIIGMTAVPEAQLAREAEICYATMAHVTDYDVWHEEEEAVNVEMLIANLMANAALSKRTIAELVPLLPDERPCDCGQTLAAAMITQRDLIPGQDRATRPHRGQAFRTSIRRLCIEFLRHAEGRMTEARSLVRPLCSINNGRARFYSTVRFRRVAASPRSSITSIPMPGPEGTFIVPSSLTTKAGSTMS